MVRNVASDIAELEDEDFYLLSGLEQGMRFSEWVARGKVPEFARLTSEEVDYRIDRCETRGLLERKTIQYVGYQLTFEGYDALALHTFAERDTLEGVGAPLGVGKESDVYEVRSYRPLALKFHREGYTEFREVNRERARPRLLALHRPEGRRARVRDPREPVPGGVGPAPNRPQPPRHRDGPHRRGRTRPLEARPRTGPAGARPRAR